MLERWRERDWKREGEREAKMMKEKEKEETERQQGRHNEVGVRESDRWKERPGHVHGFLSSTWLWPWPSSAPLHWSHEHVSAETPSLFHHSIKITCFLWLAVNWMLILYILNSIQEPRIQQLVPVWMMTTAGIWMRSRFRSRWSSFFPRGDITAQESSSTFCSAR